jgi:primosomal protein N' (replication factor Y)
LYYYEVLLERFSAPILTYHSLLNLEVGRSIEVEVKGHTKSATIYQEVKKPSFDTLEILTSSNRYYSPLQLSIAKFIAYYYFASLSESLALFTPFSDAHVDALTPIEQFEKAPRLTPSQLHAYEEIVKRDRSLLFGVTGSGKTEIFIALMIKILQEGKSAIFLMPEISLTPQMERRLRVYFGDKVAIWHSRLTKKRKESIVEAISSGEVMIVAGARSALFVPLVNLGLIVVDEEHDDSYKSNSRPRYHARDMALLIGQKCGAKVLLASATPSISSYYKHEVIRLKESYKKTKKSYRFVTGSSITPEMIEAIRSHYRTNHQSLLFLPTRGNFKYLFCPSCGATHECPYCSVGLALHRHQKHLKCHYCNYTEAIVEACTHCGHHPLQSNRMGTVEAIEVISEAIEGIAIAQFDRDAITTQKKLTEVLKKFERGESDLLLGTQMLSKGHDYPNITLSIIMGLDYVLSMGDYRARQKALSLMFQIAGRSGRNHDAQVIIQTQDSPFFQHYLGDYERFINDELHFLQSAEYPPFVSLARVLIAHKDASKASKTTLDIVTQLKRFAQIEIVGSGKAPIERVANKYRFHILLRALKRASLLEALHAINRKEIEIDFDPVEFA